MSNSTEAGTAGPICMFTRICAHFFIID